MRNTFNNTRRVRRSRMEQLERRVLRAVIYVDDNAPGPARDGSSWATAYTDLQAALDAAAATAGGDEVRVAAGTYRPTDRTDPADPRSATFSLQSGVALLGGYPDGGGTVEQRRPTANTTTLSGDLGTPGSAADNTYHVVSASGVDATAVLDGFTVTGGASSGMYNRDGARPKVRICKFDRNPGVGMVNEGGSYDYTTSVAPASPTVTNCTFSRNSRGGMYNASGGERGDGASATLADCTFSWNSAEFGGGIYIGGADPEQYSGAASATLTGCSFSWNSAIEAGGAIANHGGISVTNCTFRGNSAATGGGVYNHVDGGAGFTNCAFTGNSAGQQGGGIANDGWVALTNCTFGGNFAAVAGGGIKTGSDLGPRLDADNCIVWGNRAGEDPDSSQISADELTTIRHSLVQGGWPGAGNLDADPLFVLAPSPGLDGRWGTLDQPSPDDDHGDLRLRAGSPAIDTGDTAAVPAGATTDLAGRPRVKGSAVDMGAYEFQPPAVIHVDDTAAGPVHDGTLWTSAYTDLQQALEAAAATDGVDTIRVAAGVYRPTVPPWGPDPPEPRWATFRLQNDVNLLGGFPDGGGTSRDPAANVTTLSGDIGTPGSADDNTYHVVTASGGSLDGFTITGGNANNLYSANEGGGVFGGGDTTFANCTFTGNSAGRGGGLYLAPGQSRWPMTRLVNCTFGGNRAAVGGAMYVAAGDPDEHTERASAALTNCTFIGNTATFTGGGIFNCGNATVTNCTFIGNVAGEYGGGVANNVRAGLELTNSILWGNSVSEDGYGVDPQVSTGEFGTVRRSLVQGGLGGEGNINANPLFARDPSPGADGAWGTGDDDYGDLRLGPHSPAIDAGYTAAVPVGITTDLAGQPRVKGWAVDMGAYEHQGPSRTVYQAEEAVITGGAVMSDHSSYGGSGFVDFFHSSGDAVEFAVDALSAGTYELAFRYANDGSGTRTLGLYVNGAEVPGGAAFARTGSWSTWEVLPVTVSLTAGANRVRLQAEGQSGPNLDSMSVRLLAPQQPVTYQAEAASLAGPVVASDVTGYTGIGFADYQRGRGDWVEFRVDVPAQGTYLLVFRYANGSTRDRPLEVKVDGQVLTGRLSFAPTGSWRRWEDVTQPAVLQAGRHLVRLTTAGSNGPNLDALTVSPATTPPPPVEPVTLEAEQADLSGPVVASNVSGFTGGGFADYQHGRGDSVEFAYAAPKAGAYVLSFRYANGSSSDRPLELEVNGAVALARLSFPPTGRWSTWGVAAATIALPAGANKIRLTTIGSNGPNVDSLTVQAPPPAQDVVYLSQARSVEGWLRERPRPRDR